MHACGPERTCRGGLREAADCLADARTRPEPRFVHERGQAVYRDIHLAPAGAFVDDNAMSRPFPGGYRSVANLLVPARVWATWQYHSTGNSAGICYDGLVWCDDHWAFFPKPYRVLTAD